MRLNNRQLRRIIREEKRRVLREMHGGMPSGAEYQSDAVPAQNVAAKSFDLFGKIHSAVDQLLMRGMDPIELANELRGLADDVEGSGPMSYSGGLDEVDVDLNDDGKDDVSIEAIGKKDKPKAQDMR